MPQDTDTAPTQTSLSAIDWWRNAVIYQVYPRSFADGNGDGMGDLPGITSRIPYLQRLGVDAIWLSPFYSSPQNDGGYDVADYRDVDPRFGTLTDFDNMLAAAHEAHLRVIVDLVPNHTSSEHAWFQAALAAEPGSPERARYHFADVDPAKPDTPPNNWRSIFGGDAWSKTPDGKQWYLHLFDSTQPDLNWNNEEVHTEMESVLRFWLDRGVDGFRIDVAHGMVKAEGLPDAPDTGMEMLGTTLAPFFDQDGVHEIYRRWRPIVDSYPGDRIMVAEAWVDSAQRRALYLRSDEVHQAFNFDLLTAPFEAAQFRRSINEEIQSNSAVGAPCTWVLSNHDVQRPVTRYGDGQRGLDRARAALMLTLALPGVCYLYQGEELGLNEVLDIPGELRQDPTFHRTGGEQVGRDGCRVPLPWEKDGPSLGFGPGGSWLPQPAHWSASSVAAQSGAPDSTLELVRAALGLRATHPAQYVTWVETGQADLLAFTNGSLICVTNFGDQPAPFDGTVKLASSPVDDGLIPPNATAWMEL
ncbi:glycoside hydrolase family 13 protein [Natronoglycomyces albus]|uniref:Glycoside hydrolase family 13 protein n=1 Tax=Natronoglycomyces albus TaxID=2811108 RepID=A0A895XL40_9ACTN|nr:glycoside hydrolase family 13 protein [Natronoglycomyces albus]QSB04273.1 glycoside hydrolase family 13 protein [Natronoglycomyces albus]